MLVTGGILAVALAAVGLVAWWLPRARGAHGVQSLGVAIVAMWVTAMGVFWLRHEEPRGTELAQSPDSLKYPGTLVTPAPPAAPRASSSPAGLQAASVESLVTGLEARLAAQPEDAEGWALLAQSYAYTANEEAVERAVQRAVELGVDEQQLRERVAGAKRGAHPADWVDRAIGARRP